MGWGSAIVGAVSSLVGSGMASKSQEDAARNAAQVSQAQYQQNRADLAPYRQVGNAALNAYARAMGLPQAGPVSQLPLTGTLNTADDVNALYMEVFGRPADPEGLRYYIGKPIRDVRNEMQQSPEFANKAASGSLPINAMAPQAPAEDRYGGFYESPGYQFRFDEGSRAVNQNLAARGRFSGGAAGRALTRYGQGVASDEFGNYMNRLAAAANIGQTATNATGQFGLGAANNVSGARLAQGAGRASGYLGASNVLNTAANNIAMGNAWRGWTPRRRAPSDYEPGYS